MIDPTAISNAPMSRMLLHGSDVVGSNPPDSVVVTGSGVTRSFSAGVGFLLGSGVGSTVGVGVTTGVGSTVGVGVTTGVGNFSHSAHKVEFPVGVKGEPNIVIEVEVLPHPRNV